MRVVALPRRSATLFLLLAVACALLCAGTAHAAPGTVTGPNGLSLTVDDTTPAPGQTINFSFAYTVQPGQDGPAFMGFGGNPPALPENPMDLTFVSCGTFTFCDYANGNPLRTFNGRTSGSAGDVETGTAQFTVSNSATNGEHISMFGSTTHDPTAFTSRLTLTVTVPSADLRVALNATAGPLLSRQVNYDAVVTNNGPNAATSGTVTTQLPSQATGIVPPSSCTYNSSNDRVACPIGALANGATKHATFTVNYDTLTLGPLHAQATRTASSPNDPNPSNNSDGADCTAVTSLLITC